MRRYILFSVLLELVIGKLTVSRMNSYLINVRFDLKAIIKD